MDDWILPVIIICSFFISFIIWLLNIRNKANKYDLIKLEWEEKFDEIKSEVKKNYKTDTEALQIIAEEKTKGFPWLSQAYADYFYLRDLKLADYLENKKHPAVKSAEHLREIALKRRVAEKLYRHLKYQLEYYESLFPFLIDFKDEDIDDLIKQILEKKEKGKDNFEEHDDPARKWLTKAEYSSLATSKKYQLALDRYWQKKKSRWEIGRDYERYVGYVYESDGYNVYYQGIIEGLSDLGRDLVATNKVGVHIIQCKYWSKEKLIHEKHIFQLYGAKVAYEIDNPKANVTACFTTSTKLSDRARQFADALKIQVNEEYPMEPYPCIKCNVSRKEGEKIYHLPFDQQYDKTLIEEKRNESYVWTVKKAEELGFRRAFRWRGESAE